MLQRRETPREWKSHPLAFSTSEYEGGITLATETPQTCDLVEIQILIAYSFLDILGRPNPVNAQVYQGETLLVDANIVPIKEGEPFTTYLRLFEVDELADAFGPGEVEGRSWARIDLSGVPTGLLGFMPHTIDVAELACIDVDAAR